MILGSRVTFTSLSSWVSYVGNRLFEQYWFGKYGIEMTKQQQTHDDTEGQDMGHEWSSISNKKNICDCQSETI